MGITWGCPNDVRKAKEYNIIGTQPDRFFVVAILDIAGVCEGTEKVFSTDDDF